MRWYLTPSIGQYGAAIEIDKDGMVGRIAFAMIGDQGLAFVKWAPQIGGMFTSSAMVNTNSLILFEAAGEHISKLNNMFRSIFPVNGRGPRLIQ